MSTTQNDNEASTVGKIIAEMKSGSGSAGPGPSKAITSVSFSADSEDLSGPTLKGHLAVHASYEGLHNDDWDDKKVFDVTPADLATLSKTAPRFRTDLGFMTHEFNSLSADWQKRKSAMIKEVAGMFGEGLHTKMTAPRTARFKSRPA